MVLQLAGCGFEKEKPLVRVTKDNYEEAVPQTTFVQRGDVTYGKSEEMKLDNYEEKLYGFKSTRLDTTMLSDITFDKLYVSVGDMVKEGEALLSLKSDSLNEKIEQYTDQKERSEITIKHLRNRSMIDISTRMKIIRYRSINAKRISRLRMHIWRSWKRRKNP